MIPFLRTLARQNRLANHRLHAACLSLSQADFTAKRTSFFPSLWETLNHIIIVDWFYLAALEGQTNQRDAFKNETPFADMPSLAAAQITADERLIEICETLDTVDRDIKLERREGVLVDKAGHVLMHLMTHQIHHRGQAHAMLAGTAVPPPQLDEFLLPTDAKYRTADLAALGWTEADLF